MLLLLGIVASGCAGTHHGSYAPHRFYGIPTSHVGGFGHGHHGVAPPRLWHYQTTCWQPLAPDLVGECFACGEMEPVVGPEEAMVDELERAQEPVGDAPERPLEPARDELERPVEPAGAEMEPIAEPASDELEPIAEPADAQLEPTAEPADDEMEPIAEPAHDEMECPPEPSDDELEPIPEPAACRARAVQDQDTDPPANDPTRDSEQAAGQRRVAHPSIMAFVRVITDSDL